MTPEKWNALWDMARESAKETGGFMRLASEKWAELEADVSGGMSKNEAAKKYGVTYQAVYNHYNMLKKKAGADAIE